MVALFRKQDRHDAREEVIILLTPHIIKDDDAYAEESEKIMRGCEQAARGRSKG